MIEKCSNDALHSGVGQIRHHGKSHLIQSNSRSSLSDDNIFNILYKCMSNGIYSLSLHFHIGFTLTLHLHSLYIVKLNNTLLSKIGSLCLKLHLNFDMI